MPQFEPANFTPQFVWLAVVFALLYFGIVRATLPRLGRTIAAREERMTGDVAAAEAAKRQSDHIHDAYEAEMVDAHHRAQATVTDAKAEVTREIEKRLAETDAALNAKAEAAAAGLDRARQAALAEVERIAAEAARQIVDKLTGGAPADEAARAAVRAHLAA